MTRKEKKKKTLRIVLGTFFSTYRLTKLHYFIVLWCVLYIPTNNLITFLLFFFISDDNAAQITVNTRNMFNSIRCVPSFHSNNFGVIVVVKKIMIINKKIINWFMIRRILGINFVHTDFNLFSFYTNALNDLNEFVKVSLCEKIGY